MERRIRITRVWKYAGATSTPRAALRRAYRPRGASARRITDHNQPSEPTQGNDPLTIEQSLPTQPRCHPQQVYDLSDNFSLRRRITNDKVR